MKFFFKFTSKSLFFVLLFFVSSGKSHPGFVSINGNQYFLSQFLGSGRDGDIYLAKRIKSIFNGSNEQESTFALKIYRNPNLESDILDKNHFQLVSNELKTEDFILVYDFGIVVFSNEKTFSEPRYGLVMEFVRGKTLDQSMSSIKIQPDLPFDENLIRINKIEKFIEFAIRSIDHLKNNELSHVDLGPKNIMVTDQDQYKLIDLDSIYGLGVKSNGFDLYFSPPEVVKNKPQPGISDFYSFSFIVYQMLIGESPYRRLEKREEELKPPQDAFTFRLEATPFKNQIEWRSPGSHYLLIKIMEDDIRRLEKRFNHYPNDFIKRLHRLIYFVRQGSHFSLTEREKAHQEVIQSLLDSKSCDDLLSQVSDRYSYRW